MRKIVIFAFAFAILISSSFATDPCANNTAGECILCNKEGQAGAVNNCGACTISGETLTCTACKANFFFNSNKNTSCVACKAGCNGGNCANIAVETAATESECTSCVDGFFLSAEKVCSACSETCGVCKSLTECHACKAEANFLVRPDTGACVAACEAPKGQGILESGKKACSDYAAPNVATVADLTLNVTSLSVSALCGPSSTEDAKKKAELVGAVALITLNTTDLPTDIDVNAVRNIIKGANPGKSSGDLIRYQTSRDIWVNIPGTEGGLAALNQTIYRSNATLLYVCVNTYNVKSALKTVKIAFNGTLNAPVKFAVSLSKALTDDQLANLTCAVSRAVLNNDSSLFPRLKNNKGLSCVPKASRVLQAASTGLGDYSFEVAADQTNDNFASSVRGKLNDAKTEVTNLAKAFNVSVVSDLVALDTPPAGANLTAPVFGVNAVATNQNVTVTVNTTADARLYWVLTAKDALTATDDSVIRVNNSKAIQMGNFEVLVSKNVSNTLVSLNASTSYDLWVSGANKYDSLVKTAPKKYSFTTAAGSSFSGVLTLGSFILLVLALFI